MSEKIGKGGLLRSSAVVSVMTLLSRVLGMVRDMVVASYFGSGAAADAFFIAFKIPNFLRRLFAEVAFAHVREGNGPVLMECSTYRYRGHSMSDPAKYRTREEVQKMRDERDAIEHVRELLLQGRHASEDDLKAIDKDIKDIVNDSAEFAKESPEPALEELWTDIYAEDLPQGSAEEHA